MAGVRICAAVDGVEPAAALRLVTDYRRWPEASEAVRSVTVEHAGNGASVSSWEVTFRGGLMRWSERDVFDEIALEQRFTLIEGDPHDFNGAWTARSRAAGCVLQMVADFDLGMPSLRHVLDPIAVEALEDAIDEVLQALFGDDLRLLADEPAAAVERRG